MGEGAGSEGFLIDVDCMRQDHLVGEEVLGCMDVESLTILRPYLTSFKGVRGGIA